jgi:hypothetical protein
LAFSVFDFLNLMDGKFTCVYTDLQKIIFSDQNLNLTLIFIIGISSFLPIVMVFLRIFSAKSSEKDKSYNKTRNF